MEEEKVVKVKKIKSKAVLPSYAYDSDAGFDFRASESVKLFPGEQKNVSTGLMIEIPKGYVGLIRDRAGIVQEMNVHTCAGTFDSGFRGEVSIMLVNLSDETKFIEEGMRIAQMILIPVIRPHIIAVKKLDETERGEKGFGSTGLRELRKLEKKMKKK